uniref:Uncharacterized protein n=1 Tax=Arundo donax TaxID=35708 RepID=A0A0A8ZSC3_ARUDO
MVIQKNASSLRSKDIILQSQAAKLIKDIAPKVPAG